MSNQVKTPVPFDPWAVARRVFAQGGMLDINAMDPLDPVHLRNGNHIAEADYDGDAGREWRDGQERWL